MSELREQEEDHEPEGGSAQVAPSTGDAGRVDPADPPVSGLQSSLPVYSAHPDDVHDGSSGVWRGMDADTILREDARHLANIADVGMDEIQRELGVISRTVEGDIRRNESQFEDVQAPNGSIRSGPPPSNKYRRLKEEKVWQDMSTHGTSSRGTNSLTETRIRPVPHFGLAPVARVEGTVASPPPRKPSWLLRSVGPQSEQQRKQQPMSNEPMTFDMERNPEMDIFDEMVAEGVDTPTTPIDPGFDIRFERFTDVEAAYDEFCQAYVDGHLPALGLWSIHLVRAIVAMNIAYGIPFSDNWDEQHVPGEERS